MKRPAFEPAKGRCLTCGTCECPICKDCLLPLCRETPVVMGVTACDHRGRPASQNVCRGLTMALVCHLGGEAVCEACARREGLQAVRCTCS